MSHTPDWRSQAAAEELNQLERSDFAWEYLRRNYAYRKAYTTLRRQRAAVASDGLAVSTKFARWGLTFRVRPGPSGGPGIDIVAAGIHPDGGPASPSAGEISRRNRGGRCQPRCGFGRSHR